MNDVKIPIKTTELAHGIHITKIIIQNYYTKLFENMHFKLQPYAQWAYCCV